MDSQPLPTLSSAGVQPASRLDFRDYVVVSLWFGCNNRCSLCMLSGLKEQLGGIGFERYQQAVRDIIRDRQYRHLILSGGEVTTFPNLERYVEFAAAQGYFERLQIQSNGRRLSDRQYLQRLLACGVNEFFISVQGPEAVHDALTGCPGSFRETLQGLRNLAAENAHVVSNTVLTKANAGTLVGLLTQLAAEGIREFQVWNYFPMQPADDRDLLVSLAELRRLLPELARALRPSGRPLVLKGFPQCLPVEPPICLDSWFPATLLPDLFWERFGANGFGACVHRPACTVQECWGLSQAYRAKYGTERQLLSPRP